jgi:hypothetical protein
MKALKNIAAFVTAAALTAALTINAAHAAEWSYPKTNSHGQVATIVGGWVEDLFVSLLVGFDTTKQCSAGVSFILALDNLPRETAKDMANMHGKEMPIGYRMDNRKGWKGDAVVKVSEDFVYITVHDVNADVLAEMMKSHYAYIDFWNDGQGNEVDYDIWVTLNGSYRAISKAAEMCVNYVDRTQARKPRTSQPKYQPAIGKTFL